MSDQSPHSGTETRTPGSLIRPPEIDGAEVRYPVFLTTAERTALLSTLKTVQIGGSEAARMVVGLEDKLLNSVPVPLSQVSGLL